MTGQLKGVLQWKSDYFKKDTLQTDSPSDLKGSIPVFLLALNC